MLMQVSNDIISQCRAAIDLRDAFSPNVRAVMGTLQECIAAGVKWKSLYEDTADVVRAQSARAWDHDKSPIFAQVDAFVQRCADLLDICEAQLQFGGQRRPPIFGGSKGDSITESFEDIQAAFKKLVAELAGCNYDILDVEVTRWHDDFNTFKASVKDLEELLIKATDHAVDNVSDLADHMHLVESLQVRMLDRNHVPCVPWQQPSPSAAAAVNGCQRPGQEACGEAHQ
jgi:dynein heavy chain, axonemal